MIGCCCGFVCWVVCIVCSTVYRSELLIPADFKNSRPGFASWSFQKELSNGLRRYIIRILNKGTGAQGTFTIVACSIRERLCYMGWYRVWTRRLSFGIHCSVRRLNNTGQCTISRCGCYVFSVWTQRASIISIKDQRRRRRRFWPRASFINPSVQYLLTAVG